ncbi:hypothetical protein CHGG_00582 [Chaetomium globosum CBS 148.51]|uniref:Enoyl reductase (ER) domain-containing protein n=1 Tax=Chaetomium globosum (strain ATCC 6205 / CBS 148.51 / DSM 1962 / NBRC 6347 / NRRL 1970) TaxID=306901 RepID=Q2HGS2_CHAGB|nr:uncharacterized protein CHGG_00582 [Chaetomium globosum CBS 148.51]EAQ92347.1 hypothetical protein CHGG_00582 [Chaetomium globosum CBS 148.51]
MASVMKAIDIQNGSGPATSLFLNPSTPLPTPAPGQALIKIHAFGLNRMDLIQREGHYPLPPQAPSTLGVEFSGTIASLGPLLPSSPSPTPTAEGAGKEEFQPGDAVFGLAYGGAYADVEGEGGGDRKKKKSVLWHAGASGVSIAGIQLSRLAGASEVFATVGTDAKCRFVERELGADLAVNYKERDWVKEILERTGGRGVDLVVDFVGGEYFQKNLDVVARDGRICMLGLMGDKLEEYLPKFESGELKVLIDTVLPWEDIVKAHQLLEENKTMGKIICTIS